MSPPGEVCNLLCQELLVPFVRQSLHDLSLRIDESAICIFDFIVGLIAALIQKGSVVTKCTKAAQTM